MVRGADAGAGRHYGPGRIVAGLAATLCLLLTGCPRSTPTLYTDTATPDLAYERFRPDSVQRPAVLPPSPSRDDPAELHQPDTTNLALLPLRYLRVNFHLMNSADTLYRYHGAFGRAYVERLVASCNNLLRESPDLWLHPAGQRITSPPRRLQIELATDPETGQPAIYDHFDDHHYAYLHRGKSANRSDRGVVHRYAVRTDRELNIFSMGPPRDSLLSKTFRRPGRNGIYLGNAIKFTGMMSQDRPQWDFRFVLVHEILHALGLHHAWLRSDGCDDTPVHRNDCWARSSSPRCDTMTSNNIMDYSNRQEALTPCQIGRVHARLSRHGSPQRKYLRRDWCTYDPERTVTISRDTELGGARDFAGDIYVRRGATLTVANRLHLAADAGIYVDPGAELVLAPGAIIHNDCGAAWRGIFRGRDRSGRTGVVRGSPAALLINVAP